MRRKRLKVGAHVRSSLPARERGPLTRRAERRRSSSTKIGELTCGAHCPHASEASSHAEESAGTRAHQK